MSLVNDIKNQVKKTGSNKGKIVYFKEGEKVRLRFLDDMEDGMKIPFHDSFEAGVNYPCQDAFGRDCDGCEDDSLRTRDQYIWSVWDYEAKEVKLIVSPVNNCTPIPALVGMYDTYGTLIDRDYVITRNGKGTNTTYSVVPMDKAKFKNSKAKPLSEEKILSILDKAYPVDSDDDDDEDEKPKKNKKGKGKNKGKKKKLCPDCGEPLDECICDEEDDDDDNELDYEEMSTKELYKLCKERDIEAKPKKKASYYIDLLEAADNAEYDDDEDDEEDEW